MRTITVLPLLSLFALSACSNSSGGEGASREQSAELTPSTTTIVAQHSSKCLDARASTANARIGQWSCNGQSTQAWVLTDKGNGRVQIATAGGKCLDVTGGATANGSAIKQSSCTGSSSQLWSLHGLASGRSEIVSASSGRCLDITGGPSATGEGVLAELWDCSGEANQSWALTAPAPAAVDAPLVAKHSGKCLDVRGGTAATNDGAPIEQWSCTGEANQAWTFKDMGGAQYELVAKSSGKCLDLAPGGGANSTAIQQATCTGGATQLWKRHDLGGGANEIVSAASGRCLDVTGGPSATGDGVLTELWDCTGEANQSWSIGGAAAPAPAPTPGSPGSPSTTPGPFGQDSAAYTLTFSDEFEGTSLDQAKWGDHGWYLPPDPTPNYTVSGGSLKIYPVAGTTYTRDYRHITTDGLYYQTYGYFEIEAKLPNGKGTWPAFWLYNHDDSVSRPELDIMEAYSGGGPSSGWSDASLHPTAFAATIWTGAPGAEGGHKTLNTTDLSAGFHRYAVKWEPNKQTYYFDGAPFFTANVSMGSRMYILLSFQFGSASGAGDSTTPTGPGNAFDVRYVRAWQMK